LSALAVALGQRRDDVPPLHRVSETALELRGLLRALVDK
jgi:hypothetical protein